MLERYVRVWDSHLHDHDHVRLSLEGVHTLYQFGVMEAVHDTNLLPHVLLFLLGERLNELPGPYLFGGLLY